jgi:hypothetical protein
MKVYLFEIYDKMNLIMFNYVNYRPSRTSNLKRRKSLGKSKDEAWGPNTDRSAWGSNMDRSVDKLMDKTSSSNLESRVDGDSRWAEGDGRRGGRQRGFPKENR